MTFDGVAEFVASTLAQVACLSAVPLLKVVCSRCQKLCGDICLLEYTLVASNSARGRLTRLQSVHPTLNYRECERD